MIQTDLFPVKVTRCDPSDLNSADCKLICSADDGADYVVKTITDHPMIPASEWFCYHLAGEVGINTPVCKKLMMPDGTQVFGSRWEGGVYNLSDPVAFQRIITNLEPVNELANRLSAIYAFDLFVHNDDRHPRNYLFRQSRQGLIVLAFDFSRAWFYHGWPPPDFPLQKNCNTRRCFSAISKFQVFDIHSAAQVLERIGAIPTVTIDVLVASIPETWLQTDRRQGILSWWSDQKRQDRIDRLLGGLTNGSYL